MRGRPKSSPAATSRRLPPAAAPSGTRLLRAWSVLATCAAIGTATWHLASPAPAPVVVPAACPPPVVFATCAAPAPDEREPEEPAAEAAPEAEADEAEEPGEPIHNSLDPLIVGMEPADAPPDDGDRPTRYGDGDWDDDEITVWRGRTASIRAFRSNTGAQSLPPGCLTSPLCVLASLGQGGPVPDSAPGLGYLFGRARDDFHRGDYPAAARGFLGAVARLPERAAPAVAGPPAAAADRRWLCRSAALSLAAAASAGSEEIDLFQKLCAAPSATAQRPAPERPATPTRG